MDWISRHYLAEHARNATFETRLAIYEDQIRGWFHEQARILEKNSNHAGFVILLVVMSYIEGHAIFLKGQDSHRQSKVFFRTGFREVFPIAKEKSSALTTKIIDTLYEEIRCGLFHTGLVRGKVRLTVDIPDDTPIYVETDPITEDIRVILINPHRALDAVERHLTTYMIRLRDPKETLLRENFQKAWDLRAKVK